MSTHYRKSKDIDLSKTLSWLLRHSAEKEGLSISNDGSVPVDEILDHKSLKHKYNLEDIKRVVDGNAKKRFTFCTDPKTNKLKIKANQGHTIKLVSDPGLEPILDASDAPIVVHGTYRTYWESIKQQGLSRMNRVHIHFAPGRVGTAGVISGSRLDCDTFIYIDVAKALKDGIKFYRSLNLVILSPGNEDGYIEPKYFSKVEDKSGRIIN